MPQLQFFGPAGLDRDNRAANSARLLNCYLEPVQPGGRTAFTVKAVMGTTAFAGIGGIFVRSMAEVDGMLYAVSGGNLYEIGTAGAVENLGAVDDGPVSSLTGNSGYVTLTVGGRYFVYDSLGGIDEPTPGAFSSFGALEYLSRYTVLTEAGGRRFQWSALADPTDLPGLSFAEADGRDDNLVRPVQIGGQLYLFKERSHEVWYLTGQAGANAFERQVGGVVDVGLKAFGLLCRTDLGAFFVSDDNRAYIIGQGGLVPVSIPPVETAIAQLSPEFCFAYEDEGHVFNVIVFGDGPAWVFDTATREWHERAYGENFGSWGVTAAARFAGGDYIARTGADLFRLSRATTDAGVPLPRRMVSRTLAGDGARFSLPELEIFPRQGFAAGSIALRMSRDNGMTWGAPKIRSFEVGQYANRVIWRNLGQFRQATAEVTISDAASIAVNAEGRVRTS